MKENKNDNSKIYFAVNLFKGKFLMKAPCSDFLIKCVGYGILMLCATPFIYAISDFFGK